MLGIFLSCYKCSPAPAAPGLGIPPAWPLEHGPGNPGSLSRLRDMADTFIFAGSTSSKTNYIPEAHRHTWTHAFAEDTDRTGHTESHRQDTAPAAPTFRTHSRHRGHRDTSLPPLGLQRQKVTGAGHTSHCPGSWNHRIVRVGRDIWRSAKAGVPYSRWHRTMSRQVLNIWGRRTPQPLWAPHSSALPPS